MLVGHHNRRDVHSECRTNYHSSHSILSTPLSASTTNTRTPNASQQSMMNHARMPHRYTIATLLSLRPTTEITNFPDHLVERRFLDEENYIDIDRMLLEKAGKFDIESFNMHDAPIMPSRVYKYDYSDPVVIEKVKNRRPKDPLTPQQVAALTSVTTRHQPTTVSYSNHLSTSSHVWIDDYSHDEKNHMNSSRHNLPPQPSMPYQRQNPNQCETYTNQNKSNLLNDQTIEQDQHDNNIDQTNTIPILQRLFEAQRLQQRKNNSDQRISKSENYQQGLSAFCTPVTPQHSFSNKTFQRVISDDQNQKDLFIHLINEHLKSSTTMQTPGSPSIDIENNKEDDDKQNYFSASSSPTQSQTNLLSLLTTSRQNPSLENWFGTSIYSKTYPRMPSDHVLSACDLEQ